MRVAVAGPSVSPRYARLDNSPPSACAVDESSWLAPLAQHLIRISAGKRRVAADRSRRFREMQRRFGRAPGPFGRMRPQLKETDGGEMRVGQHVLQRVGAHHRNAVLL